jgi:GGDEF domain-containing protein
LADSNFNLDWKFDTPGVLTYYSDPRAAKLADPKSQKGNWNIMFETIRAELADFISPELKNERRRLERLAMIDPLTGVANRAALDLALPTAERDDLTAIVLFDANNFGLINKIAGHRFGDITLKAIATTLVHVAECYNVGTRVFRYGGDEFVVLCPRHYAELLRNQAEFAFGVRFPAASVSISGTYGETLAAADEQLQDRKTRRKGGTDHVN